MNTGTLCGSSTFYFWTNLHFYVLLWMHFITFNFFHLYSFRKLFWRSLFRNLKGFFFFLQICCWCCECIFATWLSREPFPCDRCFGMHQSKRRACSCGVLKNWSVGFTVHVCWTISLYISEMSFIKMMKSFKKYFESAIYL